MAKNKPRPAPPPLTPQQQDHVDLAYLRFLTWECDGFNTAFLRAMSFAEHVITFNNQAPVPQTFSDFQSAVGFAVNVAKMLWPKPLARSPVAHLAEPRGQRLRDILGIQDDPVLRDWELRNSFEHLDERVDEWTTTPGLNLMVHMFTSGANAIVGMPANQIFTRYDPTTHTLSMLQQVVRLDDLYQSVNAVKEAALKAIQGIYARRGLPGFPQGPI